MLLASYGSTLYLTKHEIMYSYGSVPDIYATLYDSLSTIAC